MYGFRMYITGYIHITVLPLAWQLYVGLIALRFYRVLLYDIFPVILLPVTINTYICLFVLIKMSHLP